MTGEGENGMRTGPDLTEAEIRRIRWQQDVGFVETYPWTLLEEHGVTVLALRVWHHLGSMFPGENDDDLSISVMAGLLDATEEEVDAAVEWLIEKGWLAPNGRRRREGPDGWPL